MWFIDNSILTDGMGGLSMENIDKCWDRHKVPEGLRSDMLKKIRVYMAERMDKANGDTKTQS